MLDMVLNRLNKGARIAICGAISQYNAASKEEIFAPKNYMSLLVNSASMRGFVVFDFASQYKEAVENLKVCWLSRRSRKKLSTSFHQFPRLTIYSDGCLKANLFPKST